MWYTMIIEMSWQRYIYNPTRTILNTRLIHNVQQMINSCKMGQRPVWHSKPFYVLYPTDSMYIHEDHMKDLVTEIQSVSTTLPCYPHYHAFWMRMDGHTMAPNATDPYFISRTWIRERNGGLNWITAAQVVDSKEIPELFSQSSLTPLGSKPYSQ